jgi:tRNA pseudouridine55 synthase
LEPLSKPDLKNGPTDPDFPQAGAIIVDKPEGMSTNDVVYKIRKSLSLGFRLPWGFRIGHGGTLDPFATGLMVIFYGEATKLANAYLISSKAYSGRIQLGVRTDTGDLTGKITEQKPIPNLTLDEWQKTANAFTEATYLQTPPMYSAKKFKGMALHHIARQGREIARDAIQKEIREFAVYSGPRTDQLDFFVSCESGTYVRTLAEDLAERRGCVAHLLSLRREQSSDLKLSQARALDETALRISNRGPAHLLEFVIPLPDLAQHLPNLKIDSTAEAQIRQGLTQKIKQHLDQWSAEYAGAPFGLLRAEDGFPVGVIAAGQLQRVLNRPGVLNKTES